MPLERSFLRSFYLTMALAGACLGYVHALTQPYEVAIVAVPLGLFLLTAYRAEGRGLVRGRSATALDLTLAAAAGLWFAAVFAKLRATEGDPVAWPVLMLPHMGLWIAILILAKLARPKGPRDFWWLQLMAFMAVALACSLDSTFFFGFLLLAYIVAALWSLAGLYLDAETQQAQPLPAAARAARRWPGLGQALARTALIAAVAVALYLVTPRHAVTAWEESLFHNQMQTGLGDALIDLNRSGAVRTSAALAFQVKVTDAAGQPKTDLETQQRWRGVVLNYYDSGRWSRRSWLMRTLSGPGDRGAQLPDLGPDQYTLRYEFDRRLTALPVLAEPIAPAPAVPVEFVVYSRAEPLPGLRHPDGELRAPWQLRRYRCNNYHQVCVPTSHPGLSPAADVPPAQARNYCQLPPLPELRAWTADVLAQLVARGQLTAADVLPGSDGALRRERHEKVARALEAHLGHSGEYGYTLNLARRDRNADPVVDFLCNVKEGHCERFASGLAVMLRSQGIPARIITGYRGTEHQGDGLYHVRQNQAHSWVEALVPRSGPDGVETRWLTLDPTPAEDQGHADLSAVGRWWREVQMRGSTLWRNFVLDYTADQQEMVLTDWFGRGTAPEWLAWSSGLALLPLLLWGVYHWRGRPRRAPTTEHGADVAFYVRWRQILARRCGLEPAPAQTAREFATDVSGRFAARPELAALALTALQIADCYYRVRYAGQALTAPDAQAIDRLIAECDHALAALGKAARQVAKPAPAG